MANSNSIGQASIGVNTAIAAGWSRVSTTGQAGRELPLPSQQAAAQAKAAELGFTIPPAYDFAVSWGSESLSECSDFQQLRQLVNQRTIHAVIVYHKDRLSISRDGVDRLIFLAECKEAGVRVVTVTGPPASDADDWAMAEMLDAYAKRQQVKRAQEGSRTGLRNRALIKKAPATWRAPYGFDFDRSDYHPPRSFAVFARPNGDWPTLKLMAELAIGGMTSNAMCRELARRGIASPNGQEWTRTQVRRVLLNPINYGEYHAQRMQAVAPTHRQGATFGKSSTGPKDPAEHVVLDNIIVTAPVMTRAQYEWLTARFTKNREMARRNRQRQYQLAGFLYCGHHVGKNGRPRKLHGRSKGNRQYYVCPVAGCELGYIRTTDLDWQGDALARTIVLHSMRDDDDSSQTAEALRAETVKYTAERDKLLNTAADLEYRQLTKDDTTKQAICEKTLARLQTRIGWLDEQMERVNADLKALEETAVAKRTWAELHRDYWDRLDDMTTAERRELFQILGMELHVFADAHSCAAVARPMESDGRLLRNHQWEHGKEGDVKPAFVIFCVGLKKKIELSVIATFRVPMSVTGCVEAPIQWAEGEHETEAVWRPIDPVVAQTVDRLVKPQPVSIAEPVPWRGSTAHRGPACRGQ